MTDPDLSDKTYIEPITKEFVEQIIELEKPMLCYLRWVVRLL